MRTDDPESHAWSLSDQEVYIRVKEDLANAAENGFPHDNMTPAEIVIELQAYSYECEDIPEERLLEAATRWKQELENGR